MDEGSDVSTTFGGKTKGTQLFLAISSFWRWQHGGREKSCVPFAFAVSEGIDSADPNWELTAMIRAWMHQEYLKVLRAAALRGQQGAVLNEFSVGDWCFGYGSEPIPGSESGRTGRNPKPRMRYIINPEHARWVRQIFQWFVHENWSISSIHRELSRLEAPKDHRSKTPGWEHQYVGKTKGTQLFLAMAARRPRKELRPLCLCDGALGTFVFEENVTGKQSSGGNH
jgi:hypothetical protein